MSYIRFALVVMVLLSAADVARAQQAAVVQLPSVSTFGVSTGVSIPDGGSISLGGISRSSSGSTSFGSGLLPGNRSFGSSLSTSTSSVHASIHDFDALDRATLERARDGQRANRPRSVSDRARRLAAARESSAGRVPSGSVDEARSQHAAEIDSEEAEAMANLKRARSSLAAGKANVAAIFYKVAIGHASGELREQIEKEAAAARADQPRVASSDNRSPQRKAAVHP